MTDAIDNCLERCLVLTREDTSPYRDVVVMSVDSARAELAALRAENAAQARQIAATLDENRRLRECATKYLGWLDIKNQEHGLEKDLSDPDMCVLSSAPPSSMRLVPDEVQYDSVERIYVTVPVERLKDLCALARTDLPPTSLGMTEQQWAYHRLAEIAYQLAAAIAGKETE